MTRLIDLTPPSFRAACRRRVIVRRWVLLHVLAFSCIAGAHAALRVRIAPLMREAGALEIQVAERWARHTEIQRLRAECAGVVLAIDRHDRLASAVRATDVLASVAAPMPPDVTLTFAAVAAREDKVRIAGTDKKPGTTKVVPYIAVELEGIASDDASLTRFVAGMDADELFEQVSLEYARSRDVAGVAARSFRITSRISLERCYEFGPALTEATP